MSVLETWTLAPVPLLACLLAVALYFIGVSRTNRQGGSWPRWRTALFVGVGIPLTVLTVTWWPGARSHQLFSAYMTQVVMLALIIPVVLVLGAPARLWREATNTPLGSEDKHRVLDSSVARAITHPLMTPLFMLALPVIVIFTPILLLTLENSVAYSAMQITLVVLGVIALLGLVGGQVPEHGIPHAAAAFIAFFELILDAIPGGVITLDNVPLESKAVATATCYDTSTGLALSGGAAAGCGATVSAGGSVVVTFPTFVTDAAAVVTFEGSA